MTNEQLQTKLEELEALVRSGKDDAQAETNARELLEHLSIIESKSEVEIRSLSITEGRILLALSQSLGRRGMWLEALPFVEQALSNANKMEEKTLQATSWCFLGLAYTNLSDCPRALEYFDKALLAFEELDDKNGVASVAGNIGLVYNYLSDYHRALEYYEKALAVFEELGRKNSAAIVTGNIGIVFFDLSDYHHALEYFGKALAIHEELSDSTNVALYAGNIGNVYVNLSDYLSALEYYDKALSVYEELGNTSGVAFIMSHMGNVYRDSSDYPRALEYYRKALAEYEELGYKGDVAHVTGNIGIMYAKEGYEATKAEELLLKAREMNEELGTKKQNIEVFKTLALLYEQYERWKEANDYNKKYYELKEEVQSEEAKKQAERLGYEHSIALMKKEAEINHLRNVELQELNTKLQKALQDLQENEQQLIHAEKMASLGQLTAGIAHELNNPIGFINASLVPLKRDMNYLLSTYFPENYNEEVAEVKEEIESLLRAIEDGAKRTSDIVKGLRTFSRLDEHELKLTDIHEGIDATLILLRSKAGDAITIQKNYGDIPKILCLPGPLNQVFMNILMNAIQAIEGSGSITVTTEQENTHVRVSIKDTGMGMSNEVLHHIFEPFYTTKPVGEGTGLGLSVCYDIIKKHHGAITVQSQPGIGTEFSIWLPTQQ